MKKTIISIAMALGVAAAFADIPTIGQIFAINGRLMFTVASQGEIVMQRNVDGAWVSETPTTNDGYYISPKQDYKGLEYVRFGYSTGTGELPAEWNEQMVDARRPVTAGNVDTWDKCNHGGYYNPPSGSVDGIPGSLFHIPDQGAEDHAIYIDLGEVKTLVGGALLTRNGFPGRIGTPVFEGSNDRDFAEGTVVEFLQVPGGTDYSSRYVSFDFASTNSVRYVRLRPNGGDGIPGWDGWFNVAEVEFVEMASEASVVISDVAMADGVISSVTIDCESLSGGENLYAAYGAYPVSGLYTDWDGFSMAMEMSAGDTQVVFGDFPAGWGTSISYVRFYLMSASGGLVYMSNIYSCDNMDFPQFYGTPTIAGNTYGDTISVTGSMLSLGSGTEDTVVTVETCATGDFANPSVWAANVAPGNDYSALLHEVDPESPSYLTPGATYYLRLRAEDGNGHVVYSDVVTMPIGEDFNKGPQFLGAPAVINGRLRVLLSGGRQIFIFQKLADDGETWETVSDFGEHYTELYSPDQSLRGRSSWRVAYVPTAPGVTEPHFWTYFDVDARYPIFGDVLCVGGVYDGNVSVYGAYDGYYFSYYEPNASAYNTENMWVGYDFGSVRTITGIRYARRQGNTGVVGSVFQFADNPDFDNPITLDFAIPDSGTDEMRSVPSELLPISARYVRIKMPVGGWFNVGEVEYDVAEDDADLTIGNVGGTPDGKPLVSVSPRYSPENGFCIYRSRKPDGGFATVAMLEGGVTEWTDNDTSLKYGVTYYYSVARRDANGEALGREVQVQPIVLYRWLEGREEREAYPGINTCIANGRIFCLETNEICLPTTNQVYYLFDDNVNSAADFYYNTPGNPRVGVDFGEDAVHVARFMLYPREHYFHRSMGLTLYGSNSESDDPVTVIDAGVALSEPTADVNAMKWWTFKSDSTEAYRVVFLKTDDGWCGGLGELRFYGYTDKDLETGGLAIFIR